MERKKLPWPQDKPFRILSLDGGGIRGLYAACLLGHIEKTLPESAKVGNYFDLIAGTSTGGIIAAGLGFSVPCTKMVELYKVAGELIFPPSRRNAAKRWFSFLFKYSRKPIYDHRPLEGQLYRIFGTQTLGQSQARLVIPSFMIPKSEIAVFKTDHHEDYKRDHSMAVWEVCRATTAAPTYFAGHERNGRMFVDGGLWANNPILVAVTEALSCFDIKPRQVEVLSVGTGNKVWDILLESARGG